MSWEEGRGQSLSPPPYERPRGEDPSNIHKLMLEAAPYDGDAEFLTPGLAQSAGAGEAFILSQSAAAAGPGGLQIPISVRRSSLVVVVITLFFDSCMYSIPFSSLAIFLKCQLREESAVILGLATGAYSLGVFLFSPLSGWSYGKWGVKRPMLTLLCVFMIGNLVYAFSVYWWMLVLGRFIVGVGDSNAAVARAYLARTTYPQERRKWMGMAAAAQSLGFAIGPLLGTLGVALDPANPEDIVWIIKDWVALDSNNAPGLLSLFLGIINIGLIIAFVRDFNLSIALLPPPTGGKSWNITGYYTALGLWLYMSSNFALVDTLFIEYLSDAYNWSTLRTGLLWFGPSAVTAFITFMAQDKLIGYFFKGEDRKTFILADCLCLTAFLIWTPVHYPFYYWQLYTGMVLFFVGFPLRTVAVITWVSKTVPPPLQPVRMAILGSLGSLARVFGPLYSGFLYNLSAPSNLPLTPSLSAPSGLPPTPSSQLPFQIQCPGSTGPPVPPDMHPGYGRTGLYNFPASAGLEFIGIIVIIGLWPLFKPPQFGPPGGPPGAGPPKPSHPDLPPGGARRTPTTSPRGGKTVDFATINEDPDERATLTDHVYDSSGTITKPLKSSLKGGKSYGT